MAQWPTVDATARHDRLRQHQKAERHSALAGASTHQEKMKVCRKPPRRALAKIASAAFALRRAPAVADAAYRRDGASRR